MQMAVHSLFQLLSSSSDLAAPGGMEGLAGLEFKVRHVSGPSVHRVVEVILAAEVLVSTPRIRIPQEVPRTLVIPPTKMTTIHSPAHKQLQLPQRFQLLRARPRHRSLLLQALHLLQLRDNPARPNAQLVLQTLRS